MTESQQIVSFGFRDKICLLETEMLKMPQVEIPPQHYFAKGLYAREIYIPAGTLLIGKIHKEEHLNIISKGDISILTETGSKRIQAPCTIISLPGTKRLGYAHTDTVWTTIHSNVTDEKDLDKLEETLIAKNYEEVKGIMDNKDVAFIQEVQQCLG